AASVDDFIVSKAPIIAIAHVRVIDGTGKPGRNDQTIVIQDGRILALGDADRVKVPPAAKVFTLAGRTVMPGLIGMHEHLFYQYQQPASSPTAVLAQAPFAKLYLAAGLTTIRTAGTIDLSGDLRMKRSIDDGREPGPNTYVTGSYLEAW